MKTTNTLQFLLPFVALFAFLFLITGETRAQPEGLGENSSAAFEYLAAEDEDGLQEFLAGLTEDERVEAVAELAESLSPGQARKHFPVLFKVLTFIQPTNGMAALETAVRSSGGKQAVITGALEGMIIGAIEHPDVDTEEDRISAMVRTGEAAAALVVGIAEETDDIDAASVAFAVMTGGMAAVESRDHPADRARALAEAMSNAGVGAALEPNKPGVARAMMLALAKIQDIEVRRGAVAGVRTGGEAAGGAPAARMMASVAQRLDRVEPVGPTPIAPELPEVPDVDPDEVSPF